MTAKVGKYAKIAEVAFIAGALTERGLINLGDRDLFDNYELFEQIHTGWAIGQDIRTEEEEGYISSYAERVLLEEWGR